MTAKERLHERVELLSEEEAGIALILLEHRLDDPLLRVLASAPDDDEPWTEADEAAIAEVEADRAAGLSAVPFEEIKRKHGLR